MDVAYASIQNFKPHTASPRKKGGGGAEKGPDECGRWKPHLFLVCDYIKLFAMNFSIIICRYMTNDVLFAQLSLMFSD